MIHTFVHVHSPGKHDYQNSPWDFPQVPCAGEYVALKSAGEWHRVELVVHCAFTAEYQAEIWVVEVNHLDAIKGAVNSGS